MQNISADDSSSIRIILLLPLSLFFIFAIEKNTTPSSESIENNETAVLSSLEEKHISKEDVNFYSENTINTSSSPVYHTPKVMGSKEIRKTETEEVDQITEDKDKDKEVAIKETLLVEVSGYSSTPDQTNCQPFITASGNRVRDGIVAANFLEFGTKIRIPEYFGDKEFVVEDRMNSRYSLPKNDSYDGHVDVWFYTRQEAKDMGRVLTEIEVIE